MMEEHHYVYVKKPKQCFGFFSYMFDNMFLLENDLEVLEEIKSWLFPQNERCGWDCTLC